MLCKGGEVVNKNISAEVCSEEKHKKNKVRETGTVWIAVNKSINRGDCCAVIHEVSKIDNYLDGSLEEFEQ